MSITPSILRRVSIAVVSVCALALLVVYAITDYYANEVSNSLDRDEYETALDLSYRVETLSLFTSDFKVMQVLCERGYVYGVTGRYDAAVNAYQRARSIDSINVNPNYGLALNLYRLGRCEDAYRHIAFCDSVKGAHLYLDEFTSDQIDSEDVLFLMADIQRCRGKYRSAAWYEHRAALGGQKIVVGLDPIEPDSSNEPSDEHIDTSPKKNQLPGIIR
ncbi:MAG TPA: hypothetical protein VK147_12180 [Candidatus Didemnitutus sp.]|nr:hypothetical protein [Candidatus Didemnitutus sp.]